jgi:hypothetical protein
VDAELVDQMARMGIETATLRQQLLLGAFNELTAMYRILRRERLTDSMKDLLAQLPGATTRMPTVATSTLKARLMRGPIGPRLRLGLGPGARAPSPVAGGSAPGRGLQLGPKIIPRRASFNRNTLSAARAPVYEGLGGV